MRARVMDSNEAISTVLGAILILGLIISVIAIAKVVYVPEMKKQAEADHMANAKQDFLQYTSSLDLAASNQRGSIITSEIEMGGGGIPFISPDQSSGTLDIDPSYGNFSVFGRDGLLTGSNITTSWDNMGTVVYQSNNRYWIDQDYSLEDGMVILSQYDGNTVLSDPDIYVTRDPKNPNKINITIIPIRIGGTPSITSSTGISTITTDLPSGSYNHTQDYVKDVTITVKTKNVNQWENFFVNEFNQAGLVRGSTYTVTNTSLGSGFYKVTAYVKSEIPNTNYIYLDLYDSNFNTPTGSQTPPPAYHFWISATNSTMSSDSQINVNKGNGGSKSNSNTFSVTITLKNSNDQTATGYSGTVTLYSVAISGNNHALGSNSGTSVTFTTSDSVKTLSGLYYNAQGNGNSAYSISANDGQFYSWNNITINVV